MYLEPILFNLIDLTKKLKSMVNWNIIESNSKYLLYSKTVLNDNWPHFENIILTIG